MVLVLLGLILFLPVVLMAADGEDEDQATDIDGDHDHSDGGTNNEAAYELPHDVADYTTNAGDPTGYNIELEFEGDWNAAEQNLILRAAEFVSDVVLSDQPDTTLSNGQTVDDLHVTLLQENLGGNTLGFEVTNAVSPSTGLPAAASITMDTGLSESLFLSTILHELIHAVGFGEDAFGDMVRNINGTLRFTGDNAIVAYAKEFPGTAASDSDSHRGVPVDRLMHHWFPIGELSNTLLAPEATNNQDLSMLTLAALEDLGLDTIWDDPSSATDRFGSMPRSILA